MYKRTKTNYEKYLNSLSPDYESDQWIIGGKLRYRLRKSQKWGTALRTYDPIAFQVGYNEWRLR